jgi:hypothetical protein
VRRSKRSRSAVRRSKRSRSAVRRSKRSRSGTASITYSRSVSVVRCVNNVTHCHVSCGYVILVVGSPRSRIANLIRSRSRTASVVSRSRTARSVIRRSRRPASVIRRSCTTRRSPSSRKSSRSAVRRSVNRCRTV